MTVVDRKDFFVILPTCLTTCDFVVNDTVDDKDNMEMKTTEVK